MKTDLYVEKTKFITLADVNAIWPEANDVNGLVRSVDFIVTGHFGNVPSLWMPVDFDTGTQAIGCGVNQITNAGLMMRALVELFGVDSDDGIRLARLKDIPVRVVYDGSNTFLSKPVAIGHHFRDRFLTIKGLTQIGLQEVTDDED
ncbi:hypothetical protein [Lacticaseibacillus mingshuiensis]|uniref:Uncharacterized protein n=1 Tax=Lacticaseibacillus mingshuiensis TaxID=2799574 RepID=A0ABW4CG11_9LACO|nr:hypothetical protein [Lacticaseibacillus mingshuiensis]